MNRKQKAMEERYRNEGRHQKPSHHSREPEQKRLAAEEYERTRSCTLEEEYDRTRACTLEDVLQYFEKANYWFFATSEEPKNWKKERDSIISAACKDVATMYENKLITRQLWDYSFKQLAIKEWKLRQTKLYKALQ